jgi:uncharacterized RDD family membrane protein YckC
MSDFQRDDPGEMNPCATPTADDGALWNPAAARSGVGGDGLRSYPLASRWHRLVARVIDWLFGLLVTLPCLLLAIIYFIVRFGEVSIGNLGREEADALFVTYVLVMIVAVLPFWFFQWHLLVKRGASTGKRMMGLRVVRTFGGPLTWVRTVIVREFIPTVFNSGQFGAFLFVIDASLIFGQRRSCLHDLMADTRVISVGQSPEDWTPEAIAASRWKEPEN